jgi:Spy/CpxP family protein refolding chaperone
MLTMKTFLLTFAVVALAAVTAIAQDDKPKPAADAPAATPNPNRFTPEQRIKTLTTTLGLTEEQQTKIKAVLEEGRGKMASFRELPQDERRAKTQEFRKAEQEKINAVLTPEQQTKYKTTITDRANAARNRGDAAKKEGDPKPEEKK